MGTTIIDKELYGDSIEFAYNSRKTLLTGVYIQCKIGEVVALLGRNGCGKSTLLKILFGAIRPKNGLIRINGIRVIQGFLTKNICYLPQSSFLPPYNTVKGLIKLMVSKVENRVLIQEDVIVKKVLSQRIGELSIGERRYFELLLLLHQEVDFYLLDEPFSGVAPYMKEQIQELIRIHQPTKGFIISDHHYNSVLEVSTHILLLQNGGCRSIPNKKDLEMFYVPEGTFDV